MRPFFNKESLWVWPVFAGVGGCFGYWMMGVEQRQMALLAERRRILLEKRARRDQREAVMAGQGTLAGGISQSSAASSME